MNFESPRVAFECLEGTFRGHVPPFLSGDACVDVVTRIRFGIACMFSEEVFQTLADSRFLVLVVDKRYPACWIVDWNEEPIGVVLRDINFDYWG